MAFFGHLPLARSDGRSNSSLGGESVKGETWHDVKMT